MEQNDPRIETCLTVINRPSPLVQVQLLGDKAHPLLNSRRSPATDRHIPALRDSSRFCPSDHSKGQSSNQCSCHPPRVSESSPGQGRDRMKVPAPVPRLLMPSGLCPGTLEFLPWGRGGRLESVLVSFLSFSSAPCNQVSGAAF